MPTVQPIPAPVTAYPYAATAPVCTVTADRIGLQVGPEGFSIDRRTFNNMVRGEIRDHAFLFFNLAVRLAKNGVDVTNDAAVQTAINAASQQW